MRSKEDEAFRRGHELGYSEGYAAGRVAGLQDARDERRATGRLDGSKGNGWVPVSDALRERFDVPEGYSRAYVIRDMTGEILEILDLDNGAES